MPQVPAGQRVTGLTGLDRRVLQAISDVDKAGGEAAVAALTLILAVDSLHTSWVAEQAALRHHWTLQPHQVRLKWVGWLGGWVVDQVGWVVSGRLGAV